MREIPLLVSLPPALTRTTRAGGEIGQAYQRACAASWRAAGFAPYSINSRAELQAQPQVRTLAEDLGVTVLAVERDAAAHTGRAHVYLADLLAQARALTDGAFAITNADILLSGPTETHALVRDLPPRRLAALPRADIAMIGDPQGRLFAHGFDFFALHAADARRLPDIGLIIGAPWWDHYLPILLRLAGGALSPYHGPPICHLMHADRWDWRVWAVLGWRYAGAMAHVTTQLAASDAESARYAADLRAALAPAQGQRQPTRDHIQTALATIAALNMSFLAHAPRLT